MARLPAGTWPSPISARSLVAGSVGISEVIADGDDVWWAETRPDNGGRTTIVRWRNGSTQDVTLPETNVRTSVHEYGGGAWWVQDGIVYFVEFADQRLRRIEVGSTPVVLTAEPQIPRGLRYADGRPTPDSEWFVCVHERHGDDEPRNEVVAVATDGSMRTEVIATGADFYAAPRVSPDGRSVVWIQWMHPNMPWDSTELWVADLVGATASNPRKLVGNGDEALQEPLWWSDGTLVVVTDRDEWWNLYRVDLATGELTPEAVGPYEIVEPHWAFGGARHAEGAHIQGDCTGDRLRIEGGPGDDVSYTAIGSLRRAGDVLTFVGSSYTTSNEVVRVRGGGIEILRTGHDLGLDPAFLPEPEFITFPTSGGDVAHGLYYAPAHPDVELADGERPPLMVFVHGGPTGSAQRRLVPGRGHRFWTSRGVAVVEVDYRGSTRYGRTYRRKLLGNWCVIDVDDAVAAARFLADRGDVDADRLVIEGGSSGGTLVLLAIANHDVFAAGTNLFGVTDMSALITDDHKFESHYATGLIGPWPDAADEYVRRSPINFPERLSAPLLVMQGSDDTVVPPAHSERIVEALRANGLPVAYQSFDGEGHGFRSADSIVRWFESDLYFYGRVLGFDPADDVPPFEIENLD
ncbi:MAG TPA: prolyl oligopeptidase family serine peptidase [Ilumatobacteraceae bacterium]|nr:prolyl oligopeptidase family serine peptidase [Ilumatobacteraceae bacterium]